jgi:hypothetical protein
MNDVIESVGFQRAQELLIYYFSTNKTGHPLNFFYNNFDRIDALNKEMTREIGNLAWKNIDEAILLLRPENIVKRGILLQLANLLRNYSPVLRNTLSGKVLIQFGQSSVNENANEEQQEYVFTGQSTGFSVSGKVEKSKRFFGARQATRRISYIHSTNENSDNKRNKPRVEGTGGNTISRY